MKRYQKKVQELEEEKKALQKENEELRYNLANISSTSGDGAQKLKEGYLHKLNDLEQQVSELKRKLDAQSQFSSQKPKRDDAMKRFEDEILRLKAQKVELQRKIKEESVQFRLCKALLEKEVLQLKKEARGNEYEMHNLLTSSQRLKLALRRKAEEASIATKRLKELLGSRKASLRETSGAGNGNCSRIQAIEHDLEVTVQAHQVCSEYERQKEEMTMMTKEVTRLKEEAEILKKKNLRCLLQDIEVECREKDSEIRDLLQDINVDCRKKDLEIRDLKEQVVKLNSFVRELEMQKAELINKEKLQNSTPMEHSMEDAANSMKIAENSGEPRSSIISSCGGSNSALSEDINMSKPEQIEGINAPTVKTALGVCCSCSKNSLCKTMKCKCRATRGTCGTSCGCAPTKCTNRETDLLRLHDSPQSEVINDIKKCSETTETEDSCILAVHGAMLLQSALVEKPAEINNNDGPRRKPLSDIKNTLIKSNTLKPSRKKKNRNSAIQLVQVAPSSQLGKAKAPKEPEKCVTEAEVLSKLPRATRAAASNNNPMKERNSDLPDKSVNVKAGIPAPRSPIRHVRTSNEKENCAL